VTAQGQHPVPAEHRAQLDLAARRPFEWHHSLRFICGFPATRDEQIVDGDHLIKAWRLADHSLVTRIGPDNVGSLRVEVASTGEVTDAVREAVTDRLRFYLSLDDDLAAFDHAARQDPDFAPIAARMHGYHQVKFPTPVENLVWSILAQRSPMPVAREVKLRLMRHLNPPVEAFGSVLQPFPSLAQLAGLDQPELTEVLRNERKARYLYGTVQGLTRLDEDFLRHGDVTAVEQALLALPGIGPWSSVFVLIRGLGRMEYLPDDAELLRAARKAYGPQVTTEDLPALAAPYAPLQGYWAHYLRAGQ